MLPALLLALALPASGESLRLDPSTGTLRVILERDGPLGFLGHDHVARAGAFAGVVSLSSASGSVSLTMDADALSADRPEDREALGWRALSAGARQKMQALLRGPAGLDAERHPAITLVSESVEPVAEEKDTWYVTARLTVRGVTRTVEFPMAAREGPGGRWFSGYVRLRPSDFGLKPYSSLGGAVRVKDEAVARFALLGRP